jgi:Bromodomain/HMG (high mobility group) box
MFLAMYDALTSIDYTLEEEVQEDWPDGMDYKSASIDHLRRILNKEGAYYPVVQGCDNPYRDGFVTEPPKKPRASYLFFQATVRSYMSKIHPRLPQAELMVILGEAWKSMDNNEKAPWFLLADEELKQYSKEKRLLEKAQKPNGVWQPIRRCLHVLNRLANDSFADIFLEPVSIDDFPDYDDIIDVRMDLGSVRKRLETRKYQGPEQFARDMRRVR